MLLSFNDISVSIKSKSILYGISGDYKAGEMVAVMGPSGSGKTTLLHVLGARNTDFDGSVWIDGRILSKSDKKKIGFVLQDDILYQNLSIKECLEFTAMIRLPKCMSKVEKLDRVHSILDLLGLEKHKDVKIENLSGGQRKRTAIGVELLMDPTIVFMDEPTSGLDSHIAFEIMTKLKLWAKSHNKLIVSTIHQPSSHLFGLFDSVLLLAEGSTVYAGPRESCAEYFESSLGYPCPLGFNLADHIIQVVCEEQPEFLAKSWQSHHLLVKKESSFSDEAKTLKTVSLNSLDQGLTIEIPDAEAVEARKTKNSDKMDWPTSFWEQTLLLAKRSLKTQRGAMLNKIYLVETLFITIIASILWFQKKDNEAKTGLIFFTCIYWGFQPLFAIVTNFPLDKDIFRKERMSRTYRLSSYLIGRSLVDLIVVAIQPTFYFLVVYWCSGLDRNFSSFITSWLVLMLSSITAQSFGYLFGTLLMDIRKSIASASVFMLTCMLASGFYLKDLPQWISWVKYLSFSMYAYDAMLQIQVVDSTKEQSASNVNSIGIDVACLFGFTIICRLLSYCFLRFLHR